MARQAEDVMLWSEELADDEATGGECGRLDVKVVKSAGETDAF